MYSVPKLDGINEKGEVEINFSSPLRSSSYDDLLANFIFFGKFPSARRYLESSNELETEMANDDDRSKEEITTNEKISQLLHMTESIRIQMIPGSALNLEKKTFNWTVEAFNEERL